MKTTWLSHFPVSVPHAIAVVLGLAFAASPLAAQPSATGEIAGRVQNEATGQYLNNARVTVKGTDLTAFTDQSGSFRLAQVPAGAVVLDVLYSGLDPQQVPVTVAAGQRAERDINLNSRDRYGASSAGNVVKLDAFVLSSSKLTEGEALATNEQRFAKNIKNVVATDAFGDVTEGNVAEFMKFMPGVTIEYSDASPNAIAVRGFDPNLTAVTADGAQLANASGSAANRSFLFTQVSINNVSRIEVTKTSDIQASFMKYTAQQLKRSLIKNNKDILAELKVDKYDREYQIWKREPLSIELRTPAVFDQKLDYIHYNPVKAGLCKYPEEYYYSSARFYHDGVDSFGILTHYSGN